jgi:hypothetical protein
MSDYFTCPACGKYKKLGLTVDAEGLIYHCFSNSCSLGAGKIQLIPDKHQLESMLSKKVVQTQKEFDIPPHMMEGFASEDSVKLALKYDLFDGYRENAYRTMYDPRLHRQCFFHKDETGKIVGMMGRALKPKQRPKAHIYTGTIKTPWVVGTKGIAVVVEDIFSAIKCYNIGYTGIALSGTKLTPEYLNLFKKYRAVIVALDRDASIQSIALKKLLDLVCQNVIIVLLDKDIKDLSRDEALNLLSPRR